MILGLDVTVGLNYVKYDKLAELVAIHYKGSPATELNVFVDINSIIKPLFGKGESHTHEIKDQLELSSQIINLCAHYRAFFRKLDVETKFFLVYGLNCPKANTIFVQGYNKDFVQSYTKRQAMRDMVENNMKALEILCPYLPGIYFFNALDQETSAFIEFIVKKLDLNNLDKYPLTENIVISKDPLALQLIPDCNMKVLRPKKLSDGDQSFIIDHDNFWPAFMSKVRGVGSIPNVMIPDIFVSHIFAMTRVPERCMSNIKSIPQAYGIFAKMLEMGYIDRNHSYTQASINSILQLLQIKHNPAELEMRWKAISAEFQSSFIIPNNPAFEAILYSGLSDLNDIKGLHSIANNEYANCPLDLERL